MRSNPFSLLFSDIKPIEPLAALAWKFLTIFDTHSILNFDLFDYYKLDL